MWASDWLFGSRVQNLVKQAAADKSSDAWQHLSQHENKDAVVEAIMDFVKHNKPISVEKLCKLLVRIDTEKSLAALASILKLALDSGQTFVMNHERGYVIGKAAASMIMRPSGLDAVRRAVSPESFAQIVVEALLATHDWEDLDRLAGRVRDPLDRQAIIGEIKVRIGDIKTHDIMLFAKTRAMAAMGSETVPYLWEIYRFNREDAGSIAASLVFAVGRPEALLPILKECSPGVWPEVVEEGFRTVMKEARRYPFPFHKFLRRHEPVRVELVGGDKSLTIELPDFVVAAVPVRDFGKPYHVRMERDSGDYWHKFSTNECDDRYRDVGCIDIGFVKEEISVSDWLNIRRRYGKDVPGDGPGSYDCALGVAHSIVRGGYSEGPDGPGFLVPEWCEYDIYIPKALAPYSVKITFVGSRSLFHDCGRAAIDSMLKNATR